MKNRKIILGIYINGYIQDRKIVPGNENLENVIPSIQTYNKGVEIK